MRSSAIVVNEELIEMNEVETGNVEQVGDIGVLASNEMVIAE